VVHQLKLLKYTSHNRALHDCGSTESRFARLCIALCVIVYRASCNRGLTIVLHVIVACVSRFALVTQTENQTVRLLYNRCSVCQSVKCITEGSVTI